MATHTCDQLVYDIGLWCIDFSILQVLNMTQPPSNWGSITTTHTNGWTSTQYNILKKSFNLENISPVESNIVI